MLMLAGVSVKLTTVATDNSNRGSFNYGVVYLEKYYIRYKWPVCMGEYTMYCSFDPVLMLIVERPQVAWKILLSYPSFNAPVISAFLLFGHPMKLTHLHRLQQTEERLQTVCRVGVSDQHQICSRTISRCMFSLVWFVVDSDTTLLHFCLVNSDTIF